MRKLCLYGVGLLLSLALVTGCGDQQSSAPKGGDTAGTKGGKDDDHHGGGPHGGTVVDWAKYHVEFTVDHGKQEATVYVLGGDAKKAAPVKADKLLLSIKNPSFQVELKPVPQDGDPPGTSSRFVGKHEHLGKVQEFEGTISGELDGKPYASDFKEEPEGHGHPHPKK